MCHYPEPYLHYFLYHCLIRHSSPIFCQHSKRRNKQTHNSLACTSIWNSFQWTSSLVRWTGLNYQVFYWQVVHNKSIKQTYIYILWSLHCLTKSKKRHGSNHISSRQSSSERIQSMGNYTAQQDFRWVPRVYVYNNTICSVVMLVMCMIWEVNCIHNWNWNQQSYW